MRGQVTPAGTLNGKLNGDQPVGGKISGVDSLKGTVSGDEIAGTLNGVLTGVRHLTGKISKNATLSGKLSYVQSEIPVYDGDYSVTPSKEEKIILVNGKKMLKDLVVEPIPHNYGLITWNGSVLTVS